VELSVVVEVGAPLVKATYNLEVCVVLINRTQGDGPLVFETYVEMKTLERFFGDVKREPMQSLHKTRQMIDTMYPMNDESKRQIQQVFRFINSQTEIKRQVLANSK